MYTYTLERDCLRLLVHIIINIAVLADAFSYAKESNFMLTDFYCEKKIDSLDETQTYSMESFVTQFFFFFSLDI